MTGQRSIAQVLKLAQAQVPELTPTHAREFFALMQDWGHVMYWLEMEHK